MSQGNNFHVEVRGCLYVLESAISLALQNHLTVAGFKHIPPIAGTIHDGESTPDRLILYWYANRGTPEVTLFPVPLNPKMVTPIIKQWLMGSVAYGREPDHDGENRKGFYLTTGGKWDHIEGQGQYSCLDIRPCWMMFGK